MLEDLFLEHWGIPYSDRVTEEEMMTTRNTRHCLSLLLLSIRSSGVLPAPEHDQELEGGTLGPDGGQELDGPHRISCGPSQIQRGSQSGAIRSGCSGAANSRRLDRLEW